jgi:putative ABC transport system ATP-binding protein
MWFAGAVPQPDEPLFALERVQVVRDDQTILGPVDLAIPADGPVVITGPSGSGKSTLLRLLDRLDVPTHGEVRFRGTPLDALDPLDLRRRVAMVFQRPVLLAGTVADNLRVADPTLDDVAVATALDAVGLDPDLATRDAIDLSGGEAQRMGLARALATHPEVVLFDEPTSSLDADSASRIEALALELQDRGVSVIWVSHDQDQVARLARHVIEIGS